MLAGGHARADAQASATPGAGLLHGGAGVVHVAQDALGGGAEFFARLGEEDFFAHALEKRHAHVLFERLDGVADRGLREVQLLRGLGEAAAPREGGEGEHLAAVERGGHAAGARLVE